MLRMNLDKEVCEKCGRFLPSKANDLGLFIDDLTLDIIADEKAIEVPPEAFYFFLVLYRNFGKIVTYETLEEKLYPNEGHKQLSNLIKVYKYKISQALKGTKFQINIHKIGYSLGIKRDYIDLNSS